MPPPKSLRDPPYGPVPDAAGKLRLAVNGMIDALIIAMDAESRGVTMPPLWPSCPVTRSRQCDASVRQEHTLHREYAETLRNMPEPEPQPAPFPLGQLPPEEHERQERAKQDEERRQQEQAAQVSRERHEREQAAMDQQERERQAAEQAQRQTPDPAATIQPAASGPVNRILP